jgi:hypothetical protein
LRWKRDYTWSGISCISTRKKEHGKRKNKRVCKEATALEENRFSTTSRKANARTSPII